MEILIPVIIVSVIGLVCGIGLSLASKYMAVPTDERQEKIRECLPSANCGACGFSGCDGYAEAVAKGEAEPNLCTAGGKETAEKLSSVLGVEIAAEENCAVIFCGCERQNVEVKFAYTGLQSCKAASMIAKGPTSCDYGCLGFGDCAKACPFGAIKMENGKPIVDKALCTGCGKCKDMCPRGIIGIVPKDKTVHITCSNKDKGAAAVKACKTSCIGCGMCVKACEQNAITIKDNLAVIDYSLCIGCGKCKEVCKRKSIN